MMEKYDSRVDVYIDKAPEFAVPILKYLRELAHETSPLLTEAIKWGFPFFEYKGPVCHMAAFKEHCSFGFWNASRLIDPHKLINSGEATAGSFGRIQSLADLPSKEILADFVLQAIAINEQGIKVHVKKPVAERAELQIPEYFTEYLSNHPKAVEVFDKFSYSHKKEYAEWITEAKSEATRLKRMETAAEWIAEGKSRHWKYQR
jgi:uncharacterized protein YdeI (YjbR/CyaY-like superfamily)